MHISVDVLSSTSSNSENANTHQLSDNTLIFEITGPAVVNINIVDYPGLTQCTFIHT
jgi:hypothetical protein